jgi:hypothetical protein
MIRNICFYNHWHNGDVFAGKAFIHMLQRTCPQFHYMYALDSDPHIIRDLNCDTGHVNQLPAHISYHMQGAVFHDTLFVNTWVGAYLHQVALPGEQHANYPSLYRMWMIIYNQLNQILNLDVRMPNDVWCAVASTNWLMYNCAPADQFIHAHVAQKRLLFCNGAVRSGQSVWGIMQQEIHQLAIENPDWQLICTQPFETDASNIYFTNHIFNQPCDMNEIAYLSTHCDLIWGKNSGPYMFCHVSDNLNDPKKVFFSCSDRPSDSYVHGCAHVKCHYYHSLTTDSNRLVEQITQVIKCSDQPPAHVMQVLT